MSTLGTAAKSALLTILVTAVATTLHGAEMRLRSQCPIPGSLVRLGDLAELYSGDPREAERLAAIELFPAPPAGQQRLVRLREIQDVLVGRGLNLVEHRFSGAGLVLVLAAGNSAPPAEPRERPLATNDLRRATQEVQEALLRHLEPDGARQEGWTVQFRLTESQARGVLRAGRNLRISGVGSPQPGPQRFDVLLDLPDGPLQFPVEVTVSRPPAVVVAVRALSRGAVVRSQDVQLATANAATGTADAARAIEDVVGRETTRAIPEGRPIEMTSLRAPVLVRRGEVVTVYARSAGIRVRTLTRAREDGALGDLVTLESLQDRKAFSARITGLQEAEVFAKAAEAVDQGPQTAWSR